MRPESLEQAVQHRWDRGQRVVCVVASRPSLWQLAAGLESRPAGLGFVFVVASSCWSSRGLHLHSDARLVPLLLKQAVQHCWVQMEAVNQMMKPVGCRHLLRC